MASHQAPMKRARLGSYTPTWVPFSRQRRQMRISALIQRGSAHCISQRSVSKKNRQNHQDEKGPQSPCTHQRKKEQSTPFHVQRNTTRIRATRPPSFICRASPSHRSPNLPTSLPSLDAPTTTTLPRRPAHNSTLGSRPRRQPFKRLMHGQRGSNLACQPTDEPDSSHLSPYYAQPGQTQGSTPDVKDGVCCKSLPFSHLGGSSVNEKQVLDG
jgi:hypothetical protein